MADDTRSLADRRKQAVATARSLISGTATPGSAGNINVPQLMKELNSYAVQATSRSDKQSLRDLALRLRQVHAREFPKRGVRLR